MCKYKGWAGTDLGVISCRSKPKGVLQGRDVKGSSADRLGGREVLMPQCIPGSSNGRKNELCLPQVPVFEASLGWRGILQKTLALR